MSIPPVAPPAPSWLARHRDLVLVLGASLLLRALFAVLIGGTYDYDEFVILLLGRDFAHGATPYGDFMFFHPPGVLVLFRALAAPLDAWWPLGRCVSIAVDSVTAALVWSLARTHFPPRTALIAGLVYALSPLALISASRIGQDPLITMLGALGLCLLLRVRSWRGGVAAGLCLGAAMWIKYPALYFLPVYFLAAPRRLIIYGPVAGLTLGALLLPFHAEWSQLYFQTVTFQRTRWHMETDIRVSTALLYWIAVNPFALPGLVRRPRPLWALGGFVLGGVFLASSQVYYHYFVPVVPFAAVLSAPVIARLSGRALRTLAIAAVAILAGWAALVNLGGPSPLFVTAAHLADVRPVVAILTKHTRPGDAVLADRYEYPYLARRRALAHYFWNVGVLVNARYLETRLPGARAAVMSYGASSGFPAGTRAYLDSRYRRTDTGTASVWILPENKKRAR